MSAQLEKWKGKWNKRRSIKKLIERAKNINATDVMTTRNFNEDIYSNKMQEFIEVAVLFNVFNEMSSGDKQHSDPTFEHGSKFIFLAKKALLRCVEGNRINWIQCDIRIIP